LPETGQTTCYTAASATTPCATTGQDGDTKAGVAWPIPRFTVGTGTTADCVTDNLTGLMWTRNANLPAAGQTWQQALDYANNLSLCGFSDWHLPNINELESLVNSEVSNQSSFLNAQGFSGVLGNGYWSSSSRAGSAGNAWFVDMSAGNVNYSIKSDSFYVWPVRAGQ
jgi:hypothetical protein